MQNHTIQTKIKVPLPNYVNDEKYIAYLRVSTKGQERSGLGLEAQRAIIDHYITAKEDEIVEEIIEAESGKDLSNRPLLKKAIQLCNLNNYTLVVAKPD